MSRRTVVSVTAGILAGAVCSAPVLAQTATPTTVPAAAPAPTAAPTPTPSATPDAAAAPDVAQTEEAGAAPAEAAPAEPAPAPPAEAAAVTAEEPAPHWYDAIAVNGFASVAYSFNFNRPADDSNQIRVFDGDDNTFNIDVVELVVQKPAAAPGDAGFRFDLTAGSTVPGLTASAGLFRNEDGSQDVDLQQAFVSYIAKVGKGLRVDAGKFVTHLGAELIEGYDGYNDNYTRSFLFGYAIAFTHTGVKLSYPITDKVSAMVMVANGWDNVKDNNSGKTLGAQLILAPIEGLTAYLNYTGGPEQTGTNDNWRQVADVVAFYKVAPKATVGVNGDFGTEAKVPVGDTGMTVDSTWYGAALYGKYEATDRLSLALRGEWFRDDGGVRTGTDQTLMEATLTPTLKLTDNFLLRGDLRIDVSDEKVFTDDAGPGQKKNQFTVALNALGVI